MKRILPLMMALVLLLAGCGGSAKEYKPEELAQSILDEVEFSNQLTLAEGAALENLYALSDKVVEYAIYYDAGSFSAEEVAVLKAKSASDAAALKTILESRVENLAFLFESYNPAEMQKISNPVIVVQDDIAVMVLSDDAGAAEKVAALLK